MNKKTYDFRWLGLFVLLLLACNFLTAPQIGAGLTVTQTVQADAVSYGFPTPATFAYATSVSFAGTGPFTIPAQDSILLSFHPEDEIKTLEFVKSLTLHILITDPVVQQASTLDFMIWNSKSGGWQANGGKNQLAWGEIELGIKYPDELVSRQGEMVIDIRNWGTQDQTIQELSVRLVARTLTGEEVTYE